MDGSRIDIPNCLTFDVEEWYRVNYEHVDMSSLTNVPHSLDAFVRRLLDLCRFADARCTFFVLGTVAKSYPGIVKEIAAAGHEVASHGYAHKSVKEMSPDAFAEDLHRSCGMLEDLTGTKVHGFRAPAFSVCRSILPWFYRALEEQGLRYSSSVFPGRTLHYGIPAFPSEPHQPVVDGRKVRIMEFPMPRVHIFGNDLGLYVRLFPAWFLRRRILRDNAAGRIVILYVHPREIDPDQPRLPLTRSTAFIHYFGIKGCEKKLRTVLRTTPRRFIALVDALEELSVTGPETA